MAHRNRWFTWVYLLKMGGFSMAMSAITRWYASWDLSRNCHEDLLPWIGAEGAQKHCHNVFPIDSPNGGFIKWVCLKIVYP